MVIVNIYNAVWLLYNGLWIVFENLKDFGFWFANITISFDSLMLLRTLCGETLAQYAIRGESAGQTKPQTAGNMGVIIVYIQWKLLNMVTTQKLISWHLKYVDTWQRWKVLIGKFSWSCPILVNLCPKATRKHVIIN